jgi:hypothetical protein
MFRFAAKTVLVLAGFGTALGIASPANAAGTVLFAPTMPSANGLVTNEYAYWNPTHADAVKSPDWEMDSGSLFAQNGAGYSGAINAGKVDADSSPNTNSAVFRLNTKRKDFGNVRVGMKLNVAELGSTSSTPKVAWDGIHIWLRYQSQYNLYYASVARRDGHIVIKKKCPGGTSNNGTYYALSGEKSGYAIPMGQTMDVAATVRNNLNGSVTITLLRNGKALMTATDTGVGCAPIRNNGAVGIRGDNARFTFTNFNVTSL